jgi:hypothetical protein
MLPTLPRASFTRLLFLAALIVTASTCLAAEPSGFVTTQGRNIVDADGNVLLLRGTNLGNWLLPEGYMFKFKDINSPHRIDLLLNELVGPEETRRFWDAFLENYITEPDIEYLESTGINHIRVPFHYRLLTDDDYLGRNFHGFEYLDRAVRWAKSAGLYVILDMHAAPCGQTGDNIDDSHGYPFLFVSPSCQDTFVEVWTEIARHYRDEPTILGYGLLNEPIAHFFDDGRPMLEEGLLALYKRTTAAIREVDPNHIVIIGGSVWNTNFDFLGEPFADNLVFEFHKYWMDVEQQEIQQYLDYRDTHEVPIYIGETGENTDDWVRDFRVLLEANDIGWAFWPYKKMDNPRGFMSFPRPEGYDLVIDYSTSDRSSYKTIRENRPDAKQVLEALEGFITNSRFENSVPNTGYIEALGLVAPAVGE